MLHLFMQDRKGMYTRVQQPYTPSQQHNIYNNLYLQLFIHFSIKLNKNTWPNSLTSRQDHNNIKLALYRPGMLHGLLIQMQGCT